MGRPRTISDDAILDAARRVFMRAGTAATTAEVARAAGVSEGTVFKRFPTKEDLLRCAFACDHAWTRDLAARVGQGDVRAQLAAIIGELVTSFRTMLPRVMMRAAHAGMAPHSLFEGMAEPPPVRALRLLAEWFEAEARLGRLRPHDPRLSARVVLGSVHNLVFHELIAPSASAPRSDESFRDGLADLVVSGLAPSPAIEPPREPSAETPRGAA